ncbi:hypothetical protein LY90DRAFT_396271 [Neocallimastix californiae]|uniref:Myosin tail domain-containing protein n=1 Tax=Neocallimastix californiae TaxID=1754190 RepID=A0A1Y2FJ07_9FUNG|nr:hypothetical protein LY90DRAFT_396271 [Neocallimastix californiae]|eukprot:ORY83364.1 hypothetical protein LY90DRAFT_396271 [Neocallimastix californiae]
METQLNELQSKLDEQQDEYNTTIEELRKKSSEQDGIHSELEKEKQIALELERSKIALEKQVKELNSRITELETCALNDNSRNISRIQARLDDVSQQLETESKEKMQLLQNARKTERTIRDLQNQLQEKEKYKAKYEEDMERNEGKIKKMKAQIEELELSESNLQIAKRRIEREANEQRERASRFEKENEKLKARINAI